MKKNFLRICAFLCAVVCFASLLTGCTAAPTVVRSGGEDAVWTMGFAYEEIQLPAEKDPPYYIAGYNNGWKPDGLLDLCRASAVWMDAGEGGVLLIGIDCVGLGGEDIGEIRDRLAKFCKQTGCTAVNIYSTHTHAGVDTLGLWGPTMVNGKNDEYTENLMNAAVNAAKAAYDIEAQCIEEMKAYFDDEQFAKAVELLAAEPRPAPRDCTRLSPSLHRRVQHYGRD